MTSVLRKQYRWIVPITLALVLVIAGMLRQTLCLR